MSRWAIIVSLSFLAWIGLAASHVSAQESPYRVEAAFLRNFARYVSWPDTAFVADYSPWQVCILGPDPFGEVLEATFQGRTEQGRPFQVFRADGPEGLPRCQIVFIAHKDSARRRAALDKLKDTPVLTVGDAPDFLREGGIIRFQVGDRVRMDINLDQARAASLTIQTRMIEVATHVLKNGEIRQVR